MGMVIKTRIVKIGNSQGIRIPKLLLDQLSLGEHVEVAVEQDQLIVRPARSPRAGWAAQFGLMAEQGDDRLPVEADASPSAWDAEEWEWSSNASTSS